MKLLIRKYLVPVAILLVAFLCLVALNAEQRITSALFVLPLLVGLFLYRVISGVHVKIASIFLASLLGSLIFVTIGRWAWQAGYFFLPHICSIVVMVPMICKWPESEVSFGESLLGVCCSLFLLQLMPGLIMGMAAVGSMCFLPIVFLVVLLTLCRVLGD